MNGTRKILKLIVAAALVTSLAVACGDEDHAEADDTANATNEAEPGDEEQGAVEGEQNQSDSEGCSEGEVYNPMTGECVEPEQEEEATAGPDTESGEGEDEEQGEFDGLNAAPNQEEARECGPAAIKGQTCRPDGGILPGATVTVEGNDCNGVAFVEETTADGEGYYEFNDIPSGDHLMTITSGSFEITEDITVLKGETLDRESEAQKLCLQGTEVSIAVITGSWDDIGSLLNGMNIEYDTMSSAGAFFSDITAMTEYDIIFVECGASWPPGFSTDADEIQFNIARYVELGNSFYVSDQAYRYIDEPLSEAIRFYNEDSSSNPTVGDAQDVVAEVVSPEMQTLLGSTTTDINFNMGVWAVAEDIGPATDAHFIGDVEISGGDMVYDAPLMSIYNDPVGDGRAIYTSFHNTAQVAGDMQDILEFMIFQL